MASPGKYPLTPSQQRMWIIHRLNPGSTAYNSPVVRTIRGNVDPQRLERAFLQLVQRHEQLRAAFCLRGTEPVQEIHDVSFFELTYVEGVAAEDVPEKISDFIRPFSLEQAPLLRAAVFRLDAVSEYVLVLDLHHIVSDLRSEDILVRDLFRLYHGMPLPELGASYKAHAEWLAEHATVAQLRSEEDFWLSKFAGELPVLQLPADRQRPAVFDFRGTIRHFPMGKERSDALRAFSASQGISLRDLALAALFVLLGKYSFQEDIIVGVPHEVRPRDDMAELVGLFINTLPIRAHVHPDKVARTLLAEVRDDAREARRHFLYDVRYLVEKLQPPRDPSRNPLYDVLFFHHRLQTATYGELEVAPREFVHDKAEVDLTFGLLETDDQLSFTIEYATASFEASTVVRMADHYRRVLDVLVDSPDARLGDMDILSIEERHQLASFNDTARSYPWRTIDRLFEEQVARTPDHPAMRYRNETIDYRELDARANRVTNLLRARGAAPGDVVALLAQPSLEMIAALLGILKAACAYLPIEPSFPVERIAHMLRSSDAKLLLTQLPAPSQLRNVEIVELGQAERYPADAWQTPEEPDPAAPACVFYTSGSTGNPKGTLVRHYNVVRTLANANYLTVHPSDRLLQLASYAFDASLFEVFGALLHGATLVVADEDSRRDLGRIATLLGDERVSIAFMTAALFNAMVDEKLEAMTGLRKILTGGERASVHHMRKAVAQLGRGRLLHMYGPTESTVFATYYPVDHVTEDAAGIPIGYPLSNTRVSILNGRSPVPVGVAGEVCIAGDGLAAGYLDEALTAQKFVVISGERVYRTGDIAKWRDDGTIEFIGRKDRQTKIRGMRIEPEEIEAALQSHPGVKAAVVLVRQDGRGDKYLQALYACIRGGAPTPDELTAYASRRLPSYMVPTSLAMVEAFSLDANGKIDRRRLPLPALIETTDGPVHPPVTEDEKAIAAIWKELLNPPCVDIHRSFFESGGHSLTAAILSSRLEQALHVAIPLRDIFEHPTIAGLATRLSSNPRGQAHHWSPVPSSTRQAYYPLSFSERMVYVHQHATKGNHGYHSIFPMLVEGTLDADRLERALRALVQRHEAFRSAYVLQDGVPVKKVVDCVDFHLVREEGTAADVPAIASILREAYDLATPPLFRACLLTVDPERHVLVLANHHIVSDGVTEALLMREIGQLYRDESLDPCPLQYRDYAVWQQRQWEEGQYRAQELHWLEHLKGPLPVLELPLDRPRPSEASFEGHTVAVRLSAERTRQLRECAAAHQTTLFTLLFAAYTVLLHKYSGQDDLIVGVPVANRTHPDLQAIAGMFVNMIPWRTRPTPDIPFADYVQGIKMAAVSAFECQDYPFERLVHALQGERDPSRNPIFDTIFVFQTTGPAVLNIEGLHIVPYPLPDASAKVDLTVEAFEYANEIHLSFTYATALFEESTIRRMAESFVCLLSDIVLQSEKPLRSLAWLTEADATRLVHGFNPPATAYPKEKSLYQLFESRVQQQPRHIAVRFGDAALTYEELHARAESLAERLLDLDVIPGTRVAMLTERSLEMVVGIWAILRIGATYVPIDPGYPQERIQSIVRDSGARVCLTTAMVHAEGARAGRSNVPPVGPPSGPAYIMYTSGSTGAPKGIAVSHHNVIRTVVQTNYIAIEPGDRILQLSNYAFDGSVFDIFGALLNGATLVLPRTEDITDPERLAAVIRESGISVSFITTALFNACIDHDPSIFGPLRKVLFGGEQVSIPHVKKAFAHLGPDKLVHVYGPTETTVFSSAHLIERVGEMVPIGRPLANTRAYVFNANQELNPIGVPGELYIAGEGVSQGYWNDAESTPQRFVPDPFVPGAVMYKTGDLVKWQDDEELLFIGRADLQVKLRGFRIEPGEIEARLLEDPRVQQCAVVVKDHRFIAYCTASEPLDDAALRAHLEKTLPYYMIPHRFVQLPQLPLTPQGKIDRRKLATLAEPRTRSDAVVEPRSPVEQSLAAVWCEAFGLDAVSVDDNFYALGGHSLKALQIVSLLQKRGQVLSVSDLFRYPTIRELATGVVRQLETKPNTGAIASTHDGIPLSAVQYRFFQRGLVDRNVFNSPFLVALNEPVAPAVIQQALHGILERHRILTVRFEEHVPGRWRQHYGMPDPRRYFARVDLSSIPPSEHDATISARSAALQGEFAITEGHSCKVLLFENYQHRRKQVLLFLFHHLVFDGISWDIFLDEFQRHCRNQPIPANHATSYAEWCLHLGRYAKGESFAEAAAHWQGVARRGQPFLPDETARPYALQKEMVHHITRPLRSADDVSSLHRAVQSYQANTFHLLLAAFCCACRDLQPRTSLPLYVMSSQRESFFDDVDLAQSIGFFAGAYPICIDMSPEGDVPAVAQDVKHTLLGVPKGGLDYFAMRFMPPLAGRYEGLDHPYPMLFHYVNHQDRAPGDFCTPLHLPVGLTHSPDNPSAYLVNVTATLDADGLQLTIYHSQAHFRADTIEELSRAFERHLQRLVQHLPADDHQSAAQ
ncbi:amino acid adenylation domain-containing protein [Pendulispora brunnea]|uniref:Amino acid adenylation domain-containing protein n=1 Tax=Pendulispora brunnea TaxID=2905690 RepID=A0ABZ2K973_9BACT